MDNFQTHLHNHPGTGWNVELSNSWDVLGPFPIQAREQHFLSPSFPIDLTQSIDYNQTWPSSYADNAKVSWTQFRSATNGDLKVSYPDVRWSTIRASEGWAGLQHHSVLRASITITPPPGSSAESKALSPKLRVQLTQGSFFTILANELQLNRSDPTIPKWYSGNVYDLEQAPPQVVELPEAPSPTSPTVYDIFVSGDYEIRLFGDPRADSDNDTPVLSINLAVTLEIPNHQVVYDATHNVTCNFIDGFAFGDALGFGLHSVNGWWTVKEVTLTNGDNDDISIHLLQETRIAPTQTRIIPLRIIQHKPFHTKELLFNVTVVSGGTSAVVTVLIVVEHHSIWSLTNFRPIKASYFFAESMPTSFLVLPPAEKNAGDPRPPILALHGAGVRILEESFWADSLARQKQSWVVIPTGRTSWGLDWHGPSTIDAWASVDALVSTIDKNEAWHPWKLTKNTPVVLIGHSNGGQGVWHIAARFPDRVLAALPAAGYIKSQSYVPLTMSRSGRFMDPSLRAILDTTLTPDDNDLFMSNLVDTPILAIHGGDDNNVPTWHSREAISVLKSWNPSANITYREDPGQPHWWPTILNNDQVQTFIDSAVSNLDKNRWAKDFTLTVAIPAESQSLHGWKIETLERPGRLARLNVQDSGGGVRVKTTNVHTFSIDLRTHNIAELSINGRQTFIPPHFFGKIWYQEAQNTGGKNNNVDETQPSGRMQAILNTAAPLVLVVPDNIPNAKLNVALRIAHDLNMFHKLDSEIATSSDIMQRVGDGSLGQGNIIIIGGTDTETPFIRWCFSRQPSAFEFNTDPVTLNGHVLDHTSLGILFLHQHPKYRLANTLFMLGDESGIERAVRLVPTRTGVTVPDWLLVGPTSDQLGAAGVMGAGLWTRDWKWDDGASWLH